MLDEPYRSAEQLVKWLTILLVANAVICLLAVWSGWREMETVERIAEIEAQLEELEDELWEEIPEDELEWETPEGAPTQSWVDAYVTTGGVLVLLIGLGQVCVGIALIVLFCLWIPRANRNARALGATGMRFTPRWCVIWYLIPIMHLFRPYQAMKEIWMASDPSGGTPWQQREVSLILPLWWTLWLISSFASQAAYGWPLQPEDDPIRATGATIFADAVDIPLAIVAMLLVRNIHRMQEHSRTTTVFD